MMERDEQTQVKVTFEYAPPSHSTLRIGFPNIKNVILY